MQWLRCETARWQTEYELEDELVAHVQTPRWPGQHSRLADVDALSAETLPVMRSELAIDGRPKRQTGCSSLLAEQGCLGGIEKVVEAVVIEGLV